MVQEGDSLEVCPQAKKTQEKETGGKVMKKASKQLLVTVVVDRFTDTEYLKQKISTVILCDKDLSLIVHKVKVEGAA